MFSHHKKKDRLEELLENEQIVKNFIEHIYPQLTKRGSQLFHQLYDIDYHEKEVLEMEHIFTQDFQFIPHNDGAYLQSESFKNLFFQILQYYIKLGLLKISNQKRDPNKITVRFSFDGTYDVYHEPQSENFELLYFQFMDLDHPHDPEHVFPISSFKEKESFENLLKTIDLVGLISFIQVIEKKK
jgi:hypothetical protein